MPRLSADEQRNRLYFRWGSGTDWHHFWTGECRSETGKPAYRVDAEVGEERGAVRFSYEVRSLDVAESVFRMLAAKCHSAQLVDFAPYTRAIRAICNPPSDVLALLVATAPCVCVSGVHQLALSERLAEAKLKREKEERETNRVTRRQWQERKASVRLAPGARSISPRVRAIVLERDNFRCRRCGAVATDTLLVVDHVTPVASGGTADAANLQTLCADCNMGKGAREPHAHDLRAAT